MSHATSPIAKGVPLRDNSMVYGVISRILHWTMAALLLWQFLGMGLRLIFGRQPVVSFFVGSHQMVGSVLFALIALRVVWALMNRSNRPDHGTGLIGIAAGLGHLALYALMMIVPTAALVRAYGSERPFAPFGFEIFPAQQPEIGWMVKLGDLIHGELAWTLAVLVLGHVVMVGVHEAMWRDGTLAKMAGRLRR